jgi:hypothetical protein
MKVLEQKYNLLPFNTISFKYLFKKGVFQEEGKEIIRKHMFISKYLANISMNRFEGYTNPNEPELPQTVCIFIYIQFFLVVIACITLGILFK